MNCLFRLDHFQLKDIQVTTNEDYDSSKGPHSGNISANINIAPHEEDTKRYRLTLKVEVLPDAEREKSFFPYQVSVTGHAFFSFQEEYEKKQVEKALRFHGVSILYGLLRGQVAQITAQSVHGQFLLPLMNFIEKEK